MNVAYNRRFKCMAADCEMKENFNMSGHSLRKCTDAQTCWHDDDHIIITNIIIIVIITVNVDFIIRLRLRLRKWWSSNVSSKNPRPLLNHHAEGELELMHVAPPYVT